MVEPFHLYAKPAFGALCTFITFALFDDKIPTPNARFREDFHALAQQLQFYSQRNWLDGECRAALAVVIRSNNRLPII